MKTDLKDPNKTVSKHSRMTTIFSDVPYDLIRYIGKYLDYDSSINFNRVLHPTERIVHRKFTKREVFEHELVAQRQTLLIAVGRPSWYPNSTSRQHRKRCKLVRDMLSLLRINRRESVVWKTYKKFYMAILNKCDEVLDPETGFLNNATPYYKKWIKQEAIKLQAEVLEHGVPEKNPTKLVQIITIKN